MRDEALDQTLFREIYLPAAVSPDVLAENSRTTEEQMASLRLIDRENFGMPGVNDYRNPHLAEAMRYLGFAQHFGVGIQIARETLARNGNPPPEFKFDIGPVMAIIRKKERKNS